MESNAHSQTTKFNSTACVCIPSGYVKHIMLSALSNWEMNECKAYWCQYFQNYNKLVFSFVYFGASLFIDHRVVLEFL